MSVLKKNSPILHLFIQNIKKDLQSVQTAAKEIPKQFNKHVEHANSVVQRHRKVFQSQSTSLSDLQERLAQTELTLHEVTERHSKEKKRRQELHNTLMVCVVLSRSIEFYKNA